MQIVFIVLVYAICFLGFNATLSFPDSAAFPRTILILMAILNTLYLIKEFPNIKSLNMPKPTKSALFMLIVAAVYTALLDYLGFVIMTPLLIIAMMLFLKNRDIKQLIGVSCILTAVVYLVFHNLFGIPVPTGVFF